MHGYSSNFDDPGAWFEGVLKDFGLHSPSPKASTVGDRAVNTLSRNIHDRGARFEGPDGRWPDNAESTIRRKKRNAPNHDTDAMLSLDQIRGEVAISRHEASMAYGKDDANRRKAAFAHGVGGDSGDQGQGPGGVTRPFLAITEADADAVLDGLADDLIDYLTRA